MNVEIKYNYRNEKGDTKRGMLTYVDIIEAILRKNGTHIGSINIYKTKVGE